MGSDDKAREFLHLREIYEQYDTNIRLADFVYTTSVPWKVERNEFCTFFRVSDQKSIGSYPGSFFEISDYDQQRREKFFRIIRLLGILSPHVYPTSEIKDLPEFLEKKGALYALLKRCGGDLFSLCEDYIDKGNEQIFEEIKRKKGSEEKLQAYARGALQARSPQTTELVDVVGALMPKLTPFDNFRQFATELFEYLSTRIIH